ncbi:DUF2384 domain-containing protein [Pseudomonas moraviensis]|uniref:antitoxin Xre/MbcA/ParS toxin-binding domain-containing protein n=1 Tax=Pseudomonas moraviensis TaxID=321662 RepID=UPI00135D5670|nr:antitoxin Xre/MbcA/ParS toxin-binding domain-containing protein [Pseudomonas moraviensis]MXI47073.1 DUF2384 domain-containing protein [Pseudomonas moraviensis]
MSEKNCWVVEIIDPKDGSGDAIINLPAELLAQTGLEIGDELSIEMQNGLIVLSPVVRSPVIWPSSESPRAVLHRAYRSLLETYVLIPPDASDLAIHKAIESGFSAAKLQALCDDGVLRTVDREWIIPSKMFHACLKDDSPLDAGASDRMYRAVHMVAMATAVFGTSEKATHWLTKPKSHLAGTSPFELLQTTVGFHYAEEMLVRISEGLYS